jgi:hypothetical protein
MAAAPRWTDERLEHDRLIAITRFRDERVTEPLDQYVRAFDAYRGHVERLLDATGDLADLSGNRVAILTDPDLLEVLRYMAGPPISADDLKTVADATLTPSRLAADPAMATRVAETVRLALDRRRFPWVSEGRMPMPGERDAAVLASTALIATQRLSTHRRSTGKNSQEQAVADALAGVGFTAVPTRTIATLGDAPGPGGFCGECMLGTRKADFVIGLPGGRTMAVECKVSNSSTNSVKRLNNDAAAKAQRWLGEFGTVQMVPAAVLSGVFKRHNLTAAQDSGLSLFWAHDLGAFTSWVAGA